MYMYIYSATLVYCTCIVSVNNLSYLSEQCTASGMIVVTHALQLPESTVHNRVGHGIAAASAAAVHIPPHCDVRATNTATMA